jgi:hypothetical protein
MSSFVPGVLVDDSGRRRRALRLVGRAVSVLLLIWLGVLALAWLGIEPLGNLGFPDPGISRARPPALPARIESAVAGGRIVAPRHSVAVVAVGARPIRAGERSGGASGRPRNIHLQPGAPSNAKPVHKHLPARGSIPSNTGTTPSSAHARAPVRSPKKSPQTPGAVNPGKSQSSPGQAKRPTTAPSSTGSPSKSTTSPGHTKEPGHTSAQPASANGSAHTNSNAIGTPHDKTTTSPAP